MLENELYDWLKGYGIPTPEFGYFRLTEEPDAMSYPVALKIVSPRVVHKSDVGGVMLHLNNRDELRRAKQTIIANLAMNGIQPDDKDGWIVTRMYTGIELFFGVIQDAVFGKVIVFGAGGVWVELFKDVCYIDSEAGEQEIERAIRQTRISRIFTEGFRGKKYDVAPVIALIRQLQQLEVKELDFNPVMLTEGGLVVVDARVLLVSGDPMPSPAVAPDPEASGREARPSGKKMKFIPDIFRPEKTVIVGVSGHAEKAGYALAENSRNDKDCCYVNPHLDILFDKKVFSSIDDLPLVDTAVLCIPAASLPDTIERLVLKKVKNIIVITAGFREAGRDEHFLQELAEKYAINIIGPNCLGIYANHKNLTFGTGDVKSGEVNLFSQSGAIVAELMDKAANKSIGFENIISVGNMADVDFADLIHSYPGSNAINLYVEGIANGKNLLRAIRESRSPVSIFKAGRTEAARRAAFSHTGNLAGNYPLFAGLVRSAGAKILSDINGLLYPYHFQKVLIITNAGGAGTVMSDLISDKLYSLSPDQIGQLSAVLPAHWSKNNPIDIIGDATHERYGKALEVADHFGADVIYVLVTPQFMTDSEKISELFVQHTYKTKIFPVLLGGELMETAKSLLRRERVAFFEELAEAVSFL
jgi:acyl-CoA synthetase (NDP forming)